MIRLVLGGARSGKSRHAQDLAVRSGLPVTVIATAEALDDEMAERIARHRAERPGHWTTVEEPLALADALRAAAGPGHCVLVDCLTLWLANWLAPANAPDYPSAREALLSVLSELPGEIILVANEVGLGVVPVGEISRCFVDEAGRLNQDLAILADEVLFLAAGLPLRLKPMAGKEEKP